MNSKVEKWLTIGALAGWVASMGSLMVLAVRAASPRVTLPTFASPASAENVRGFVPSQSVSQHDPVPSQTRKPLEMHSPKDVQPRFASPHLGESQPKSR